MKVLYYCLIRIARGWVVMVVWTILFIYLLISFWLSFDDEQFNFCHCRSIVKQTDTIGLRATKRKKRKKNEDLNIIYDYSGSHLNRHFVYKFIYNLLFSCSISIECYLWLFLRFFFSLSKVTDAIWTMVMVSIRWMNESEVTFKSVS